MAAANRPPPISRVGARVRIKAAHQQQIEALFAEAAVQPLYKEVRADGNLSYWFGKDQIGDLRSTGVVERIPLEWWAHVAAVGSPTKH